MPSGRGSSSVPGRRVARDRREIDRSRSARLLISRPLAVKRRQRRHRERRIPDQRSAEFTRHSAVTFRRNRRSCSQSLNRGH